jgi:hypothetical protein
MKKDRGTGDGKTMNAVQRAYIKAKAVHEMAEDRVNELEAAFLASRGRTETNIWEIIDDESALDRLSNEFSEIYSREEADRFKARDDLKRAEDALIAWGLSLIPEKYKKEADILRSSRDYKLRQELIALPLSFDVKSIPRIFRKTREALA